MPEVGKSWLWANSDEVEFVIYGDLGKFHSFLSDNHLLYLAQFLSFIVYQQPYHFPCVCAHDDSVIILVGNYREWLHEAFDILWSFQLQSLALNRENADIVISLADDYQARKGFIVDVVRGCEVDEAGLTV